MTKFILESMNRYLVTNENSVATFEELQSDYLEELPNKKEILALMKLKEDISSYCTINGKIVDNKYFPIIQEYKKLSEKISHFDENLETFKAFLKRGQRESKEKELSDAKIELDNIESKIISLFDNKEVPLFIKSKGKEYLEITSDLNKNIYYLQTEKFFKKFTTEFNVVSVLDMLDNDINSIKNTLDIDLFLEYLIEKEFNVENLSELETIYI